MTSYCKVLPVIHWIIHSYDLIETANSCRNKASGCLYEWIIESLTQMINSKTDSFGNKTLFWDVQKFCFVFVWKYFQGQKKKKNSIVSKM